MSYSFTHAESVTSVRPDLTAGLVARTGLDEKILSKLVGRFYDRVRVDPLLGPLFAEQVGDWPAHEARMVSFWSSVALMSGQYHGKVVAAHDGLALTPTHFDRWLALFRATASETCPPAGARHVVALAERIARTIARLADSAGSLHGLDEKGSNR